MKNKSVYHSELILNLNERLFLNALKGVTAENAKHRISSHNNPIIWIATHVIWARYQIAAFLGQKVTTKSTNLLTIFFVVRRERWSLYWSKSLVLRI